MPFLPLKPVCYLGFLDFVKNVNFRDLKNCHSTPCLELRGKRGGKVLGRPILSLYTVPLFLKRDLRHKEGHKKTKSI